MKSGNIQKPNSRAVAAEIVAEWLDTGEFTDHLMECVQDDRAFVMEVVSGVARWKRTLEWIIKRCAKRKPDREVMPFLLVGLYQIFLMDKVEQYAAVNETVSAVKSAGLLHVVAFSNAIFRRALREKTIILKELAKQSPVIKLSHPDVLVERWSRQFGPEKMQKLLEWNNSRPEVVIRPVRAKIAFPDFIKTLKEAGIEVLPHPFAPEECLVIPRGINVVDIPGYQQGFFTVQDPSTLLSVRLLDPQPGEFVLDACAAPGGKTMAIAERMAGKGRIVAMDIQEDRLETLRENLRRLEIKSVTVLKGDAVSEQDLKKASDGRLFDRILLDVPCTNTGVLRRRADARWRFSIKGLTGLTGLQKKILSNASAFLKPGGIMVYSTCSLEPEEDEQLMEGWLSLNPGFSKGGSERLFPPETQTDGAYGCAIVRNG